MSPGHSQQIEILFILAAVLFTIIFGVIFIGVVKNARKQDKKALAHEKKMQLPPAQDASKERVPEFAGATSAETVEPTPAVAVTSAVVVEKDVDLKEALKKPKKIFSVAFAVCLKGTLTINI